MEYHFVEDFRKRKKGFDERDVSISHIIVLIWSRVLTVYRDPVRVLHGVGRRIGLMLGYHEGREVGREVGRAVVWTVGREVGRGIEGGVVVPMGLKAARTIKHILRSSTDMSLYLIQYPVTHTMTI
jgi:hypothetical protein